jgi:hypothetical protein
MGRGINSGLIQIRPGWAQNMALERMAPGQQRGITRQESIPVRADRLAAVYAAKAHCEEAPLRAACAVDHPPNLDLE